MPGDTGQTTISGSERPPFPHKVLDAVSSLSIGVKINLFLLGVGVLPPLAGLLVLHHAGSDVLLNSLALYIAAFLLLYYPLARAMEEFIVLRQTRRINAYVEEVKAGRRTPHFQLPKEKGGEHDFLRLQRNIFWMVQGLRNREARLQATLNSLETAQRQVLENIRLLQQMDRQELKEHYKRVRRQEPEQGSKGAGLGFIEMFRRASEPLECHVAPIDEETVFFSVKARG